jgi:hypothetical protein
MGAEPMVSSPEKLGNFIRADIAEFHKIVMDANIAVDRRELAAHTMTRESVHHESNFFSGCSFCLSRNFQWRRAAPAIRVSMHVVVPASAY